MIRLFLLSVFRFVFTKRLHSEEKKFMDKQPIAFRVSSEVKAELSAIAQTEKMQLSTVVRILLEIGIDEYRKAKTRAGASSNLLQLLDRK